MDTKGFEEIVKWAGGLIFLYGLYNVLQLLGL
jgi:hypothetical protein